MLYFKSQSDIDKLIILNGENIQAPWMQTLIILQDFNQFSMPTDFIVIYAVFKKYCNRNCIYQERNEQ